MARYTLVKTDAVLDGPVDYSTPVGSTKVYRCEMSVSDRIDRRKPAGKNFTANPHHNKVFLGYFEINTGETPDFVRYAKGKSGRWYVEAVYL